MLNRFRIGTQLAIGFFIVLVLLIGVAITGYIGVTACINSMNSALNTEDLQTNVQMIQTEALNAQIVSCDVEIYGDLDHVEARYQHDKQIAETIAAIEKKLPEKSKNDLLNFRAAYQDYIKADDTWNTQERAKRHANAEMVKEAEILNKTFASLRDDLLELGTKTQAKEVDGVNMMTVSRCEQIVHVEFCITNFEVARRLLYMFMLETDEKIADAHEAELLEQRLPAIERRLDELDDMVEDTFLPRMKEVHDAMERWKDCFNKLSKCFQEQAESDVFFEEAADEVDRHLAAVNSSLGIEAATIRDAVAATSQRIIWVIIIAPIVAVLIGIVVSILLGQNISSGIRRAVEAMTQIAKDGNLTIQINPDDLKRGDEVGDLSQALQDILHEFQNVGELVNNMADGNWTVTAKERGDRDSMNIDLNKMLNQVNLALSDIASNVSRVATGANEVSSSSMTLSSGSQESAASLEQITASMGEISGQTKQNATGAAEARDLAQKATQDATKGQNAMQNMIDAMKRITENSDEIQRVIRVIDDIAFQTNLLALNAAVEAARAGVHGKGFAVVAEEVRNLASRSAKAAAETTELISKSGQEIQNGAEVASQTAEILNEIVDQIKQTNGLVTGIADASNEQAQGVAQVTLGLQQIDQVTQQNTAAAEQSASAANEMSSIASHLQRLVSKFKLRKVSPKDQPIPEEAA